MTQKFPAAPESIALALDAIESRLAHYGLKPKAITRTMLAAEEVIAEIKARGLSKYENLVFCGFGEPTERLTELLAIHASTSLSKAVYSTLALPTNWYISFSTGSSPSAFSASVEEQEVNVPQFA